MIPVKDLKYDVLKHPNVLLSVDGKGKPYIHGEVTEAIASVNIDFSNITRLETTEDEQESNILDDYDKAYGLKSVRLRYFNVAGADTQSRIGEWHEPETHLIPNILKSTFSGGQTFKMFGTDYDTVDGTCVRDYINVENLIEAHLLALNYLNNGGETNFFNLGTTDGNSVKQVFSACEEVTAQKIPVEVQGRREGDPATLVADNRKAIDVLKWNPDKSLKESVKTAYDWEKVLQSRLNS